MALVIFLVLYILYKVCGASRTNYILSCMMIFLCTFGLFPVIMEYFAMKFPDSRTVSRLTEVAAMIQGNEKVSGSGRSRMELSMLSLKTWLGTISSFFWGIGDARSESVIGNFTIGIGNHAEFFDVFARYGLIGAGLFFNVFLSSVKPAKREKRNSRWLTFFIPLMVYGFVNNVTKYAAMAVLIYLYCLNILENQDSITEGEEL